MSGFSRFGPDLVGPVVGPGQARAWVFSTGLFLARPEIWPGIGVMHEREVERGDVREIEKEERDDVRDIREGREMCCLIV